MVIFRFFFSLPILFSFLSAIEFNKLIREIKVKVIGGEVYLNGPQLENETEYFL